MHTQKLERFRSLIQMADRRRKRNETIGWIAGKRTENATEKRGEKVDEGERRSIRNERNCGCVLQPSIARIARYSRAKHARVKIDQQPDAFLCFAVPTTRERTPRTSLSIAHFDPRVFFVITVARVANSQPYRTWQYP